MKQKEKKWTYVNKWYIILPLAFLMVIYLVRVPSRALFYSPCICRGFFTWESGWL